MLINRSRLAGLLLGAGLAAISAVALHAQEDDLFDFIPPGGRTLLGDLIAQGALAPDEVLGAERSSEQWRTLIEALDNTGLDDVEVDTLSAYLAATMPAAQKGGKTLDTGGLALPRDGRDLTMEYCQSCHIITVVITQERTREAWLGTMNKPSHVEIDTSAAEREAIADFLILNGGISIDDVPEELRAGGATY
jgi:hypothetical protein